MGRKSAIGRLNEGFRAGSPLGFDLGLWNEQLFTAGTGAQHLYGLGSALRWKARYAGPGSSAPA